MCQNGTLPDRDHSKCLELPEKYLRLNSFWAIGAMTFALIGIIMTIGIFVVFIRNNDTPVVRASGRELSYVLLVGFLMCYGLTFILMQKPTTIICGIQEFMIGLCFSVVYGALLTKTNRISRIFNASTQSAKRPNFISPKSQLCICTGIVLVQVFINVIWFLTLPPEAVHHHPTREDNLLVCKASINAQYMIAFSYPILLVIICTVYAVLTRKIPEAFNESKFIGFSMYTTCIIWLAFIPIYFTTSQHVALRITSMSVTISLSATVTIVCLFTPKLYIILLHPEKNIRQSMMNKSQYGSKQQSVKIAQPPHSGQQKALPNGSIEVKEKVQLLQTSVKNGTNGNTNGNTNGVVCSSCSCPVPNETTTVIPSIIKETTNGTNTNATTKVLSAVKEVTSPLKDSYPPLLSNSTKTTKEIGAQTDNQEDGSKKQDGSTQTKTQWLQISLSSPPLSLTQEVPDVVL